MSKILLPGDPPMDAMREYISNLHQQVIQQDRQLAHLAAILREIVMQHGIDNAITVGPPILRGGAGIQLRIEPTISGGATIRIAMEENESGKEA